MMNKLLGMVALASVAMVSGVWAEGSKESFLTAAIQGNLAEIQAGQLAQNKGFSQGVKDFGKHLVADHTAANEQAVIVAEQAGVAVPTAPSKDQQLAYDKLTKFNGKAFDRRFVDAMKDGHKQAIAMYEDESTRKDDGPVQVFAVQTLPTLRSHLAMVDGLEKSVNK